MALIATCLTPPAAGQGAESQLLDGVRVRVDTPWPNGASRGWAPVIVDLDNRSGRDMEVSLRVVTGYTSRMSRHRQSTSVRLRPEERRRHEMLVPMDSQGRARRQLSLAVRAGRDARAFDLGYGDDFSQHASRRICVLRKGAWEEAELATMVAALPMDDGTLVRGVFSAATPPGGTHISYVGPIQSASIFPLPLEDLPRRAEAWSSVDTVVVDAGERLPADRNWAPLLDWVRSGGQLALVGGTDDELSLAIDGLQPLMQPRHALTTQGEIRTYRAGFGIVARMEAPPLPRFALTDTDAAVRLLAALDRDSGVDGMDASALEAIYAGRDGGWARIWPTPFPEKRLPLRPVVAFLLLFSLCVGPLNVVYARRKKKPLLLLLSVPAMSLVATLLVLGFGILREGFGIEGFAHSVAIIDQDAAFATTIERREMTVGRGGQSLQPAPGTTVLVPDRGEGSDERIVSDDGQQLRLTGDFLPVRSRTRHLTLRNAPTRLRLEIERQPDGTLEVTNGLGVDLNSLVIQGPEGETFPLTGALAAGDKAVLGPGVPESGWDRSPVPGDPLFGFVVPRDFSYVAYAAKSPTADNASVAMAELSRRHAILGTFSPEGAGWSR